MPAMVQNDHHLSYYSSMCHWKGPFWERDCANTIIFVFPLLLGARKNLRFCWHSGILLHIRELISPLTLLVAQLVKNLPAVQEWKRKSLSRVRLFATPWTVQSMEFSRLEYWSGQPFPSPGVQETQVQSLCAEDPLEREMATHSGILAWKIPWTEGPGEL